jgi:hypothetical protein
MFVISSFWSAAEASRARSKRILTPKVVIFRLTWSGAPFPPTTTSQELEITKQTPMLSQEECETRAEAAVALGKLLESLRPGGDNFSTDLSVEPGATL